MLKMIYFSKTNSPVHNLKKFYSPKIEKQNIKKVNSKLINTISIPDKKISKNNKYNKFDKNNKSPNQRNSFSLLKTFDNRIFKTSLNIPFNPNKLIKITKKKRTNNITLSLSNDLIYNRNLSNKSLTYGNNKNSKDDKIEILKLSNDLIEYRLKNSRLINEIAILNEKIQSQNEIINIKENENKLYKEKYSSFIEDLKSDNLKLKQNNIDIKKCNDRFSYAFKNLLNTFIDLIEFIIGNFSSRSRSIRSSKSCNKNITNSKYESSIDIYDSFNTDEEKKNQLLIQIKNIILIKVKYFQSIFINQSFEREIEKIQNLNNLNLSSNIKSLCNMSNIFKTNNNEISNSVFNEIDLLTSQNINILNSTKKIKNNQNIKNKNIISDSLLNAIKSSPINTNNNSFASFIDFDSNESKQKNYNKCESVNTSIIKNININITSNDMNKNNFINILNCSFGNLIPNDNHKISKKMSLPNNKFNELNFDS
jgi:hypothetical protein